MNVKKTKSSKKIVLKITMFMTALRPFYCSLFSCDKRMTAHGCALRSFYCSSLSCDNWMINQSGDFVCSCLPFCLIVFVTQAYKRLGEWGGHSSLPSSPFHHYSTNNHVFPDCLPVFFQRGRLCSRHGGSYGTGRGSL